jgi:hypothetical protein
MTDATQVGDPGRPMGEEYDNPLERLRLLSGDDDAIARFLDELDVSVPREREMLAELARTRVLARPERFDRDHRRAIEAIESLRRHGFHGSRAAAGLGPVRLVVRWLIELIARYLVVSHLKNVAMTMRNLYWLREMEAESDSRELKLLRPARFDASYLVEITRTREIGVPSFVIAGLLIPLAATIWRLMTGFTFETWWVALAFGLGGVAIGVGLSWIVLRGSAMAGSRIRVALREPLLTVWDDIGHCGRPPKDGSRKFAIIAIVLMAGVWVVFPAIVALAFAT